MKAENWQKVDELFHEALERDNEERRLFLATACNGDQELLREVQSMLAHHQKAKSFMETPAYAVEAKAIVETAAETLTGRTVGSYQVLGELGRGGMGEVYLAFDDDLKRKIALKFLRAELTGDRRRLRRFQQEARAASALNHPNILTVFEIGQMDDQQFIATEFVEGQTLRDFMNQGQIPVGQIVDIALQIGSALSAAHAVGVIHRDIKPENIMLRMDGYVKVVDFGLAKLTEQPATPEATTIRPVETESGVVIGTVIYMSPEQARGLPVDARTDIWSLGVVLYEMITRRAPFMGATNSDVIASILEREPLPLKDEEAGHAPALRSILNKTLRKRREERYQTVRELLDDLKNLRRELETHNKHGTSIERAVKLMKRGAPVALLLGIVTVAVIATALYKFGGRNQSRETRLPVQIVPFTTFSGRELQPAFSPDGDHIAFVWNGERGDNFDIYYKLVNTEAPPLRLTSNPADDLHPAWSPDGRQIAFVRQMGTEIRILTVPVLGGPERMLYSGTTAFFSMYEYGNAICWSPDGRYLAFSAQRSLHEPNSIFVLSLETLELHQITTPPTGFVGDSTPAFSPDGKVLAFVRGALLTNSSVYVMQAAGGEPKRLTFDNRSGRSLAWTADGREIVFSLWFSTGLRPWKVPADGGTPEQLSVGEDASTLAISRRGDRFAYSKETRDTNIWRIGLLSAAGKRTPIRSIYSTRQDFGPQYSPDGRRIVFVSDRTGNTEIWACNADGLNPLQLTFFGGPDVGSPRWSSDSRQIAFDSILQGHRVIFVISAEGGQPRRLTEETFDDVRPSWSKDKQWIYFGSNRTGEWQLWKQLLQGGPAVQITKQGGREGFESVDGKFIYYAKGFGLPGLWRVPVEGGDEIRVLDEAFQGFWALVDRGVYFINPKTTPHPSIDFLNFATGRKMHVATIEKALELAYPSLAVSPDNQSLLYVEVDSLESDIMLAENFR
jgi:serine/threonine protein kinase/Tol biopolymer transport system component